MCGANIILTARNADDLNAVKKSIKAQGRHAEAIVSDVSSMSLFAELASDIIGKFGQIDILINNAGITHDNLIMRMKDEDWDKVIIF